MDWKRSKSGSACSFSVESKSDFCVHCPPEEIAIATPGPTKKATATELRFLWEFAKKSIREAEAIVFVGYRFPPSDAQARGEILGAILDNAEPHLALHTVLGPNRGFDDSVRLAALLTTTCERAGRVSRSAAKIFSLVQHPMWSQDFFSVWHRDIL